MRDLREQVDDLAALMDEFKLEKASLKLSGFQVTFKRRPKPAPATALVSDAQELAPTFEGEEEVVQPAAELPPGQPVSSPMAGIFYLSSSPSTPPFVKQGDSVTTGQTIGLIEAMKVFNEIPSPFSGTVLEVVVENGTLVQPGQVLVRIG